MIVQGFGGGLVRALPPEDITAGPIEWLIALGIAWYLTEKAVGLLKGIQERRNGASDLYMDPKTGARMSFPVRNLQILHELVEEGCERTELVKENGEVLVEIRDIITSHDEPIKQTAAEIKAMNDKLVYTGDAFMDKIGEEMRAAVSDEMMKGRD